MARKSKEDFGEMVSSLENTMAGDPDRVDAFLRRLPESRLDDLAVYAECAKCSEEILNMVYRACFSKTTRSFYDVGCRRHDKMSTHAEYVKPGQWVEVGGSPSEFLRKLASKLGSTVRKNTGKYEVQSFWNNYDWTCQLMDEFGKVFEGEIFEECISNASHFNFRMMKLGEILGSYGLALLQFEIALYLDPWEYQPDGAGSGVYILPFCLEASMYKGYERAAKRPVDESSFVVKLRSLSVEGREFYKQSLEDDIKLPLVFDDSLMKKALEMGRFK